MSQAFEILCIHGEDRKLIFFFEQTMNLQEFKEEICRNFGINGEIKLVHNDLNAEITSKLSSKPNLWIRIIILGQIQAQNENPNLYSQNRNDRLLEQESNRNEIIIPYDELLEKKFKKKELLDDLNLWANPKRFHLYFSEGPKEMKKRIKRTLSCIEKDCKYKLMMISEDQNDNFVVYEKLSKKYTAHSKFI